MSTDLATMLRQLKRLRERRKVVRAAVSRPDTGAARKAALLDELTGLWVAEAQLWAGITDCAELDARDPAGALLLRASVPAEDYALGRAKIWSSSAATAHSRIDAETAEQARAFDDGMTYVPGRGRVREAPAVIDVTDLARGPGLDEITRP